MTQPPTPWRSTSPASEWAPRPTWCASTATRPRLRRRRPAGVDRAAERLPRGQSRRPARNRGRELRARSPRRSASESLTLAGPPEAESSAPAACRRARDWSDNLERWPRVTYDPAMWTKRPDPEQRRRLLEALAGLRERRAQLPPMSDDAIDDAPPESRAELARRTLAGWEPGPSPTAREMPADLLHSEPS
jgi:hypothetical protein